jgi:hypothetical protein
MGGLGALHARLETLLCRQPDAAHIGYIHMRHAPSAIASARKRHFSARPVECNI